MVVTGARKRQRFRESNSDVNDVSGELPEEPRTWILASDWSIVVT